MAKAFSGNSKCKLYIGSTKVKKGYIGNTLVYSAGNVVTYNLDQGVSYKEEIDSGSSCLAPATFTPAKPGWTFVGWREDSTASGDVLSSRLMNDDPIDLYAVFQQDVVLTTGMNNAIYSQQTLPKYYNNGNTANPTFTVASPSNAEAAFKGWSSSSASADISYNEISSLSLSESLVLYAVFVYENATIATSSGEYYPSIDDWFNDKPHTFVFGIDCSKYSGITATYEGLSEANGGSASQQLWVEAGETKIKIAESYCDYTGNSCYIDRFDTEDTRRTVTITFKQTSGTTDLIGYGEAFVYSQGHGGWLGIYQNTATLIGKTVIG